MLGSPVDSMELQPELIAGIEDFKRVVGYDRRRNSVNFATSGVTNTMGALTSAMCTLEPAKIPTMISAARGHMQSNPQSKLVLCVKYTDSINQFKELAGPGRVL